MYPDFLFIFINNIVKIIDNKLKYIMLCYNTHPSKLLEKHNSFKYAIYDAQFYSKYTKLTLQIQCEKSKIYTY